MIQKIATQIDSRISKLLAQFWPVNPDYTRIGFIRIITAILLAELPLHFWRYLASPLRIEKIRLLRSPAHDPWENIHVEGLENVCEAIEQNQEITILVESEAAAPLIAGLLNRLICPTILHSRLAAKKYRGKYWQYQFAILGINLEGLTNRSRAIPPPHSTIHLRTDDSEDLSIPQPSPSLLAVCKFSWDHPDSYQFKDSAAVELR